MPGTANRIALAELPVPAGAANTPIDDPIVTGLLDYFAFWLRTSLNGKLTSLPTGRLDGTGSITDAVPTANRFPWNPAANFVRGRQDNEPHPLPALYVWWTGRSAILPYSLVYDMRRREIGVSWIFEELVLPGSLEDRHGLIAAADSAIASAVALRRHPSYGYNGQPAGTPIAISLNLSGHGIQHQGSQHGWMSAIPGDGAPNAGSMGNTATGHVQRAYPALQASVWVFERVENFDNLDPQDVGQSIPLGINANGDGGVDDATEIIQCYLDKPDGTESFPNP